MGELRSGQHRLYFESRVTGYSDVSGMAGIRMANTSFAMVQLLWLRVNYPKLSKCVSAADCIGSQQDDYKLVGMRLV